MSRALLTKAGIAGVIGFVALFEGYSRVGYLDPVGIPTDCFGNTHGGVIVGKAVRTDEQCRDLLGTELWRSYQSAKSCTTRPMTSGQAVAYTSLTYNIGAGAFCKSTLVKLHNAGDSVGACLQLDRWNKAKGITLPGLTRRRAEERKICLGAA